LRIEKGVVFHNVKKLTKTTFRVGAEGNNVRELVEKGWKLLSLFLRGLDNARADKHLGAEPAGCKHPFSIHFLVKHKGILETFVVEKRRNAALVYAEARGAII